CPATVRATASGTAGVATPSGLTTGAPVVGACLRLALPPTVASGRRFRPADASGRSKTLADSRRPCRRPADASGRRPGAVGHPGGYRRSMPVTWAFTATTRGTAGSERPLSAVHPVTASSMTYDYSVGNA